MFRYIHKCMYIHICRAGCYYKCRDMTCIHSLDEPRQARMRTKAVENTRKYEGISHYASHHNKCATFGRKRALVFNASWGLTDGFGRILSPSATFYRRPVAAIANMFMYIRIYDIIDVYVHVYMCTYSKMFFGASRFIRVRTHSASIFMYCGFRESMKIRNRWPVRPDVEFDRDAKRRISDVWGNICMFTSIYIYVFFFIIIFVRSPVVIY